MGNNTASAIMCFLAGVMSWFSSGGLVFATVLTLLEGLIRCLLG